MSSLGIVDWAILAVYLAAIFGLGIAFSRGQRSKEEYFVGGRKMNWFAVGLSLFAAAFSANSFVALPREGAYQDFHFFLAILCIPVVITPLLWWVFVPLYTRLQVTSVYEYLEIRFHRSLRRLGTVLFAGYAIGWMGSMLYAIGLILQAVLGLTNAQFAWCMVGVGLFAMIYTALGGVKAVIWVDVLQAVTLGGSAIVILVLALQQVHGGWDTVVQLGQASDKFAMFNLKFDLHQRASVYAALAFGLFMYLPGYTTSQVTVQRYVCMPNLQAARKALVVNAVMATLAYLLFIFLGTVVFAYYHQPGAQGFPELFRQDQILPYFVTHELHVPGLVGLMIAGLFAAGMSTLEGGINSLTAVVIYDWFSGRDVGVTFSRIMTVLVGCCVIGAALLAPYLGQHLIEIITKIAGTFLGLLLGVYLLGMFFPRANTAGAWLGLSTGALCLVAAWLRTDLPHWWYGAVTCFPTLLVGAAASGLFPPPRGDQLRGLVFQPPTTKP